MTIIHAEPFRTGTPDVAVIMTRFCGAALVDEHRVQLVLGQRTVRFLGRVRGQVEHFGEAHVFRDFPSERGVPGKMAGLSTSTKDPETS